MFGKAFVRPLLLTIVVSFFVAVARFAQKEAVSHGCDTASLYTLRGSNPGPTD